MPVQAVQPCVVLAGLLSWVQTIERGAAAMVQVGLFFLQGTAPQGTLGYDNTILKGKSKSGVTNMHSRENGMQVGWPACTRRLTVCVIRAGQGRAGQNRAGLDSDLRQLFAQHGMLLSVCLPPIAGQEVRTNQAGPPGLTDKWGVAGKP